MRRISSSPWRNIVFATIFCLIIGSCKPGNGLWSSNVDPALEKRKILAFLHRNGCGLNDLKNPEKASTLLLRTLEDAHVNDFETLLEFGVSPDWSEQPSVWSTSDSENKPKEALNVLHLVAGHPSEYKAFFEPTLRYAKMIRKTDEKGEGIWHKYLSAVIDDRHRLRLCSNDLVLLTSVKADFCSKNVNGEYPADLLLNGLPFDGSGERPHIAIFRFLVSLALEVGSDGLTDPGWEINKYAYGAGDAVAGREDLHAWIKRLATWNAIDFHNQRVSGEAYELFVVGDVVGAFEKPIEEEVSMCLQGRYLYGPLTNPSPVREFDELVSIWTGPHVVGRGGFNYLFASLMSLNDKAMRQLLEMGVDPDRTMTEDLWTLTRFKELEAMSPSFTPKRGQTLLHVTSLNPKFRDWFVPMLLEYSKKPDKRDRLNRNALHFFLFYRVMDSQRSLLRLLVDSGVDINAQSISGATPAHNAVIRNANLIPHLVELGADLQLKDWRGESVIDRLRQSVHEKWTFWEESQQVLEELGYGEGSPQP